MIVKSDYWSCKNITKAVISIIVGNYCLLVGPVGAVIFAVAPILDYHASAVGAVVLFLVVACVQVEVDRTVELRRVNVPAMGADRIVCRIGKRPAIWSNFVYRVTPQLESYRVSHG